MTLSDLLKQAKVANDAYRTYAAFGGGGAFSNAASGLLNGILQKSINKSSPEFKATQPSNAPTIPSASADGFKFMTRMPEQSTDFSGMPAAARGDLQGVDYFKNLAMNAVKPETKQAAIDWLDRQMGGYDSMQQTDTVQEDGGYDFGGGDNIDFSTPTSNVAYSMEKLNELYGTKSPEDLWALRQKLRLQESQASAGMLPEEEYMRFGGDGITDGAPRYNYDQRMGVNRATADIFSTQVADLDKFMSDQSKSAGSNNQNIDNERALLTSFNSSPVVKEYNAAKEAYQMIKSIDSMSKNPSQHQALITKYAKFLDPTSVVRESEFAVTQKYSQSKLDKIANEIQHAMNGTGVLSQDAITAIQGATKELFSAYDTNYKSLKKQYEELAKRQGLDPQNVVFDYSLGIDDTNVTSEASSGPTWKQNPDGTFSPVFSTVGSGTKVATGNPSGTNRPQRNNNPLNIKSSSFTSKFPGVKGIDGKPASDGGHFLVFATPQDGFNAAVKLLKEGKSYKGKTVDQAMRIWSNNGYGGNIAPQYANMPIQSLPNNVLQQIIQNMARAEGYYA